ncbi:CDP-alcohol phosphatidyltransferase family protein [Roseibium album]|jgi:CDP-diacylglycerol--serine O-phosphatidyltransferase|uniref:CDP-alcohol phosphatidyltransferase family protein n=1 Tax=Roseibium album TaxID=311410 RepID=UPI00248F7CD5|nr:CDP-alcohol phosphatidyltransferase family protein [Roseibium album]MCR9059772.1 CDP-alcohol phosphatidyltransferase family protein [Paracoccaceae bacterium]
MTIEKTTSGESHVKPILSYLKDLPNICSLAGLGCSLLAIYFILIGVYPAAIIGMVWAVAFDWADGIVARRMSGRTGADREFGGQLDLLIDVVSYAVTPTILILNYAAHNPLFLPVVFVMLVFGVIRLSYFSTFGLSDDGKYTGLAIDNNSLALVFLFLFEGYVDPTVFAVLLGACGLGLAVLNVSQIKTPKLSGNPRNVALLAAYTLAVTLICGWKIL